MHKDTPTKLLWQALQLDTQIGTATTAQLVTEAKRGSEHYDCSEHEAAAEALENSVQCLMKLYETHEIPAVLNAYNTAENVLGATKTLAELDLEGAGHE